MTHTCIECDGKGEIDGDECWRCDGDGLVTTTDEDARRLCAKCRGSGEGYADGTWCSDCHGSGEATAPAYEGAAYDDGERFDD